MELSFLLGSVGRAIPLPLSVFSLARPGFLLLPLRLILTNNRPP